MSESLRKYEIYSAEYKADPLPILAQMRRDDPILKQIGMNGQTAIYFATRYSDVERILRDDATFARDIGAYNEEFRDKDPISQMLNNHMLNKDGADHRRLRALVGKAFTPGRVRALRPRIQTIANELIDGVIAQGGMDLMAQYAYHLPTIVILEMLGIPTNDRERFKVWSQAVVDPVFDEASVAEFFTLMKAFLAFLAALFADRRANPGDDLVSALVYAEEAGDRLSENELFSMVMLLIVAGHETTVSLICNAMVALWKNPDQLALLMAQPALMPTAVEELLRYDGPVERPFTRYVTTDVELSGTLIPAGSLIVPIATAANHDPAVFDAPEQLDIMRAVNPHLAFGKGAHYCVGAPLARLEAEIALNTLLRRIPTIRPAVPLTDLEYRLNPTFHTLKALPTVWD